MTDVVDLAKRLYMKVSSQTTPEEVNWTDLVNLIEEAIESLYVISGRALVFSADKFTFDETGVASTFEDTQAADECQWVVLKAQIEFYKWVQASVDDATSYTTDAMSVTHGDKPYEHIGDTIGRLEGELARIWYTMTRYNQLGVS